MTPQDIALVKSTFALVKPISEQAAELFYGRLFEIAPHVKPLFKGDMKEQGRKLMATLGTVVASLDNLGPVLPVASDLAKRHVGYGVKAADYTVVGEALLWTLEKGLGNAWTAQAKAAWTAAYTTLSTFMIAEAYPAA
jgi:hemoglobin-like flavoprotein